MVWVLGVVGLAALAAAWLWGLLTGIRIGADWQRRYTEKELLPEVERRVRRMLDAVRRAEMHRYN